jgi:hypothetical protein
MILPPEYVKEVCEIMEYLNALSSKVRNLYLSDTIEIMLEGAPIGARLVDDGMGNATYNVEFYEPEAE